MDWTQVLGIILGNIAWMFPVLLWMRSESNADRRDILSLINEIKNEQKDFHGRLCSIEERKEEKSKLILEEMIRRGK